MNVLVYDESRAISRLMRSVLLGLGARVSLTTNPDDAQLKLETLLFDAIVLGPKGVPRSFAEYLDKTLPELPVVLAGVNTPIPSSGRVLAALTRPISIALFRGAMERMRRNLPASSEVPAEVIVGGDRILCSATKFAGSAMMLVGAERLFEIHDRCPIIASVGNIRYEGEVVFSDGSPDRRTRWLGVRLLSEGALCGTPS